MTACVDIVRVSQIHIEHKQAERIFLKLQQKCIYIVHKDISVSIFSTLSNIIAKCIFIFLLYCDIVKSQGL